MKIKSLHLITSLILPLALTIFLLPGCEPDAAVDLGAKPTASFTLAPIAAK